MDVVYGVFLDSGSGANKEMNKEREQKNGRARDKHVVVMYNIE